MPNHDPHHSRAQKLQQCLPKQRFQATNSSEYDAALRGRGSPTIWFTDTAIAAWKAEPRTTRGGQPGYSALAITTALTLRGVFRLALRQTEGLIGSIIALLGLDLAVPDHSTLSRRAETLEVPRARLGTRPIHLLVDSTGLQLCGPGEWLVEKHGSRTRRSWRKLHTGMDADTGRIVASSLTASDVDNASQVGPLLDQVADPIASFTADAAYDQDGVYAEIAARHPGTPMLLSSCHHGPVPCRAPRPRRPRPSGTNIFGPSRSVGAWLAEDLGLSLACPGRGGHRALQAGYQRWTALAYQRAPRDRSGHRCPRTQRNARTRTAGVCPHHVNADQPGAYRACKVVHATQSCRIRHCYRPARCRGQRLQLDRCSCTSP
jgi:hypothetical protein